VDSKSTPNWTAYFLGKTDLFVGGSQIISKRNLNLKTRQKKRAVGALKARKKKLRVRAEIFLSCFPLEKAVFFPVTLLSGMRANQLASSLQLGFFGVEVKRSHPIRRLRGFSTPFFLHLTQTQCSPSFARRVCFFARTEPLELDLY